MSHQHREAFHLMWYACDCGHRERFWNSRDGVTPFGAACPSCNDVTLRHVDWQLDRYEPHYQPAVGQRVWIDMTPERAAWIVDRRAEASGLTLPSKRREALIAEFWRHGTSPDLMVFGYGTQEQTPTAMMKLKKPTPEGPA